MDQRKALFRAKLREREAKEKQEKRIDPSLVRSPSVPLLLSRFVARIQQKESGSFPG